MSVATCPTFCCTTRLVSDADSPPSPALVGLQPPTIPCRPLSFTAFELRRVPPLPPVSTLDVIMDAPTSHMAPLLPQERMPSGGRVPDSCKSYIKMPGRRSRAVARSCSCGAWRARLRRLRSGSRPLGRSFFVRSAHGLTAIARQPQRSGTAATAPRSCPAHSRCSLPGVGNGAPPHFADCDFRRERGGEPAGAFERAERVPVRDREPTQ